MTNPHGSKWIRPAKRLAIYARDEFTCVYCEQPGALSLDHICPRELGGSNEATNLITACISCNSSKQDFPRAKFYAFLRDRGIDTTRIGARIRCALARPINIQTGKRLLAERQLAA